MTVVPVAAAQYPIGRPQSLEAWADGLGTWVAEAADAGARLLVFPEYGAIELASTFGPAVEADLAQQLTEIGGILPEIDAVHAELAARHGVFIAAASAPALSGRGPVNRARLFGPGGGVGVQGKQVMTRFEREDWGVGPDPGLAVFDTPVGKIGIVVCYDIEFPLIARALAEAGAAMLLVPSCTDSVAGYWRVRIGAMARALENQLVTVQSVTVGEAPWSPAVDVNRGAAGVYGPPDLGFPDTGVISEGRLDQPGWVHAEIDLASVTRVRAEGHVLNHAHWTDQPGAKGLRLPDVALVPLA